MNQQPDAPPDEQLIDTATLARLLGVPGSTLRRHIASGAPHIPAPRGRIGNGHYWRRADIDVTAIKSAWPKRGGYRARRPRATEDQ